MREAWTDDRLDDLNHKVDEGFKRVGNDIRALRGEMNGLRTEMNERFIGLEARFDAMRNTQALLLVAIVTGLVGVIASILATGA